MHLYLKNTVAVGELIENAATQAPSSMPVLFIFFCLVTSVEGCFRKSDHMKQYCAVAVQALICEKTIDYVPSHSRECQGNAGSSTHAKS